MVKIIRSPSSATRRSSSEPVINVANDLSHPSESSTAKQITMDGTMNGTVTGDFSPLQSEKSSVRLKQIAALRARGIGDHIGLPQLVVCGDQSAGKSSVLEGISGFPFPREDGLCTRFPTEIILEHSEEKTSITASILPSSGRPVDQKLRLKTYKKNLNGFGELPKAISEAGQLMGIRGFGSQSDGPAFGKDVLRIKVSGPTGLHLTVVDLPGLISVPSEEQTDDDVKTVHELVDSYAANSRTIILAVVQAGNDIANQPIVKKARTFDKGGERTIGIITKPDLINKGAEKRIALLAKNLDTTKLKLGFFLVKNPTPSELEKGVTLMQRQKNEMAFFNSSPWLEQRLDKDRVGIMCLRQYLQLLLDEHIERELPTVREEIRRLMTETNKQMGELGTERPTVEQCRAFLVEIARRFQYLVAAAERGDYQVGDGDFFAQKPGRNDSRRLRAFIHRANTDFANELKRNGKKIASRWFQERSPVETEAQDMVTEEELLDWVKQRYQSFRGRELNGNTNPALLGALFHEQSSLWLEKTEKHLDNIHGSVKNFMKDALQQVTGGGRIFHGIWDQFIVDALQKVKTDADEELQKIWKDERRHPLTYNHYYTDNLQKSHDRALDKKIAEMTKNGEAGKDTAIRPEEFVRLVQRFPFLASLTDKSCISKVVVDMEELACRQALTELDAYYKLTMKTFVDNVCRQVIERHILRGLDEHFSPAVVSMVKNEDLMQIAAEPQSEVEKRKYLRELKANLQSSLNDLSKHN